ncbi:MAG TPA: hypothetical protein PLB35_07290 [Myxococcota bacterium]|nr:hypothetical protein [Myxococcota bacterium]HOA13380.1 hypothetical protein [Myxococcota bacterium]HOH77045.1 hypothetical protein [Myxococcota bacterium]HPV04606.1 hypothetical protein [Myxococcota bacterium]
MKLFCINCGEGFAIDDSSVGLDGATVKCVHCAVEQPVFTRRKSLPPGSPGMTVSGNLINPLSEVPSPPPAPPKAVVDASPDASTGSGFRKPLSSMWAGKSGSGTGQVEDIQGDPTVKMVPPPVDAGEDLSMPPPVDDGSFVIGGVDDSVPEISIDVSGGPFTVASPSLLSLEFPDFSVLDEWSRGIEKLEKYTVSDRTGNRSQLGDFLRKRKQGGRAAAVKAAMRTTGETGNDTITDILVGGKGVGNRPSSITQQFEFKVVEEKKRGPSRSVVLAILGTVIVVGAVAASLWFYFFQ